MKKPYQKSDGSLMFPFTHPKIQVETKLGRMEKDLESKMKEFNLLAWQIQDLKEEMEIWKEWLNIVRTYEITDEVRERLIRTDTYIITDDNKNRE